MTREELLLKNRFVELARTAEERGIALFSDFLSPADLSLFDLAQREFPHLPCTLFGGAEGCERVMVRFGDEVSLGYSPPPFPIVCLELRPRAARFAEPLSHRDCLGALMSLGVRRECLGDIALFDGKIYLFCAEKISPYLQESLTRVRHTDLSPVAVEPPAEILSRTVEEYITVSSLRTDGVVAHAFSLSRTESTAQLAAHRVFVNGRLTLDGDAPVGEGDLITLRGAGRVRLVRVEGQTKKGRLRLLLSRFV